MKLVCELGGADLAEDAEGEADEIVVSVGEVDPDAVGGHHEEFGLLVEELGESEVADALLDEGVAGDELEALHLAEVGLLARHVDEEQLGDIAGTHALLIFLSRLMGTAKLSRMTAISFWYSARSSAMVLQLRMRVKNSSSLLIKSVDLFKSRIP